ncbi:hypothetical protein N7472_009421 [Penicillium cf. griseofulvum]|uniref:Uncharacterized protein n=1 Tax=Penicillium cf. griseofulvum TaxID=2972120 RepID=A0A9W9IW42_9EURO|nr:hypothetical protein N7472_009421 [Penicillium cf. griseofulvum]KAJ5435698.1 hypothetical protein N7445_006583 [Penicillium cf. griseofulvum]
MSSSILHQCPHCGHVSDISNALAAFIENPHCKQCGMSASESDSKVQDELSALFDRQMSMTQLHPAPRETILPPQAPEIAHSITQHYHHSAHRIAQHTDQPSSIDILRHHGLDPNTLTHDQLALFENADAEQRERLIQTWQLYSQFGNEDSAPAADFAMHDSAMDDSGDGNVYADAEPYMVSGYENDANQAAHLPKEPTTGESYVPSKDPVYQGQQWWEMTRAAPMESQYGAFQEMGRYYPSCGVYHH